VQHFHQPRAPKCPGSGAPGVRDVQRVHSDTRTPFRDRVCVCCLLTAKDNKIDDGMWIEANVYCVPVKRLRVLSGVIRSRDIRSHAFFGKRCSVGDAIRKLVGVFEFLTLSSATRTTIPVRPFIAPSTAFREILKRFFQSQLFRKVSWKRTFPLLC